MRATTTDEVCTRWMIRADLPQVVEVEMDCTQRLNCQDILELIRGRNNAAHIVEDRATHEIVGWYAYALTRESIELLRFGVRRDRRGEGIGTGMLCRIAERLVSTKRIRLYSYVDEEALDLQLFLARRGFVATSVHHDKYLMVFSKERFVAYAGTVTP